LKIGSATGLQHLNQHILATRQITVSRQENVSVFFDGRCKMDDEPNMTSPHASADEEGTAVMALPLPQR
jgi:hypothetical protein